MKLSTALSITACTGCVLMSAGVLAVAFSNHVLHAEVQGQQQALRAQEGDVENKKGAVQALNKRIEEQEQARDAQEKLGNERQNALYAQQEEIQKLQQEIQRQQEQINLGNQIAQQVAPNLLRDLATASLKNDMMKALLRKHGYNVETSPGPAGSGGARPIK